MTQKKYEFTGEVKIEFGVKLHRIRALVAIATIGVAVGDLGGWIEKEKNLNHYGNAWVFGNAQVSGNARVSDDAQVSGNAWVSDDAQVFGNAWVFGNAQVSGNAWVYGNARVSDDAQVYGDARVYGNAQVYGDARVYGDAWVFGNAQVFGDARHITISPIGSEGGCLTAFVQADGTILFNRGCFSGTDAEFLEAVEQKHGDGPCAIEYRAAVELIKLRLSRAKDAK